MRSAPCPSRSARGPCLTFPGFFVVVAYSLSGQPLPARDSSTRSLYIGETPMLQRAICVPAVSARLVRSWRTLPGSRVTNESNRLERTTLRYPALVTELGL